MLLPNIKQKIIETLRDKRLWILIIILGIGAYLRLWHIDSLFNAFEAYDEGTLTLQARFIAEGFLPYKDFTMVHPPFYYLVMAVVYKIFGYSLFYAKYLSVFLSLASIILIYLTGKKLYHTGAALVVASLFAVSPDMVYIGRRAVQESLGIFLVILAIYFIAHFIINQRKKALIFSGLALGLALSTKYIFSPAVLAIFLILIVYLMGEKYWNEIKRLARPSFLLVYVLLTTVFFTFVFVICWSFNLPISVPLLYGSSFSTGSIILVCGVCILTLFLTLLIMEKQIFFRERLLRLGKVISKREVWYLASGILFGFIAITGYFWISVPYEFSSQTIALQENRLADFPSFITMLRGSLGSWEYLKIAFITGLLSLPVALVMLNKNNVSRVDYFVAIAIIISVVFCQFLGGVPRYYYSVYPLFLLGLAGFVPRDTGPISADIKTFATDIKVKILGVMAVMFIFLSTSIVLIVDYPGYDYGSPRFTNDEQYIYEKTIDYLESVSPNKVYAANPIFIALASQLTCNLDVDTFALLKLKKEPAEQLIQDNIDKGAEYFVLDYWARNIVSDNEIHDVLEQAIRQHARLVQRIGFGSINYVEIYQLVPDNENILNSDFSKWAKGEYTTVPSGWQSAILSGEGDNAVISKDYKDGKQCIRLEVEENGLLDGKRENTFCRIHQSISFPVNRLTINIMSTFNADTNNEKNEPISGTIFTAEGHTLTISFSDTINTEQFVRSEDGHSVTVIRPAELGQWSEETIDLASYWAQAGWEQPDEIDISFIISIHYSNPGTYNFYIANIKPLN